MIGNPPYISHDKIKEKSRLKQQYNSYEPFADIYCYFIELGLRFQSSNGSLSFITSNSYLRADYGNPVRKIIRQENEILSIINLDDTQVFESAIVNVAILISSRHKSGRKSLIYNSSYQPDISLAENLSSQGYYYEQENFDTKTWGLITLPMHVYSERYRRKERH